MLRLSSPGCISDFKGDVLFIVIALHVAQLRSNIHVAHSAGHMPGGRSVRQMQMANTAAEGLKVVDKRLPFAPDRNGIDTKLEVRVYNLFHHALCGREVMDKIAFGRL